MMFCGCVGVNGGGLAHYVGQEKLAPMESWSAIAFAKDWHEDPTSNHHVLRELAKSRRVLWLNSIGTRTPKLSSGRGGGPDTTLPPRS